MTNIFAYLAIASQILTAVGQLASGQPVTFKTYIGKTHIQVTVEELAS